MEQEENNNLGRPPKPINWKAVDTMIEGRASQRNICKKLEIDKSTFIRRFKEHHGIDFTTYATEHLSVGAENIILTQYARALKGNTQLLILLGKEWCGQGEKDKVESTVPNQAYLDVQQRLYAALYEIEKLKNVIKPQAT